MNYSAMIQNRRPVRAFCGKEVPNEAERNSKHSKCSYTCEKRCGLTGISLQNSKTAASKSGVAPHRKNARPGLAAESRIFVFGDSPKSLYS